jgi:ketosteroid isomerase-like protein
MSQENVELVQRAIGAFDSGEIESALSIYSPEVIFYPDPDWPEDEVYRGYDGLRKTSVVWADAFDDVCWDVHEIRDLEDRIFVHADLTARMKDSGAPIRKEYVVVCSHLQDGTIGEVRFFTSWEQALGAVGVTE